MVTRQDIHNLLKRNGVNENGTVLIHTSMRAIGKAENGCDGIIDAFISYLKDGLFLVPTHTWAMLGNENPVYDVRSSLSCIGALPNVAILRKDGVRSLHPTHSLKAFGKRAKEYVKGEEKARTPCPTNGAWARLYEEDATIFLLGVGLERNTYIHAIEEELDIPNRLAKPKKVRVIDNDGMESTFEYCGHEGAISEFFSNFTAPLEKLGALTYDTLGNATVQVFHVKKGTEILKNLWSKADYDLCECIREIPKEYYL